MQTVEQLQLNMQGTSFPQAGVQPMQPPRSALTLTSHRADMSNRYQLAVSDTRWNPTPGRQRL